MANARKVQSLYKVTRSGGGKKLLIKGPGNLELDVKINEEAEIKIGFGREDEKDVPLNERVYDNEAPVMRAMSRLWTSFRKARKKKENEEGPELSPGRVPFADGTSRESRRKSTEKEYRLRHFFQFAALGETPEIIAIPGLEIRQEEKDGRMVTMIKIGNGASEDHPVIHRKELEVKSDFDVDIRTILSAVLKTIPEEFPDKTGTRKALTDALENKVLFSGIKSGSDREKKYYNTYAKRQSRFGPMTLELEWAMDQGSSITTFQKTSAIREFECEVKAIYVCQDNKQINVKTSPEKYGFTKEELLEISTEVLEEEYKSFQCAAEKHFNSRQETKDGRIAMAIWGVFHSKSHPCCEMLKADIKTQPKQARERVQDLAEHGFYSAPMPEPQRKAA